MISLFWFFTIISFAGFYARVARANFSFFPTLLSVFGLPSFAALLRESAKAHEQGIVTWRGREYHTDGSPTSSAASNSR
jgi:hypothetical protein